MKKKQGIFNKMKFNAHKGNISLMKLLVSDENFQELVREIRIYLKLPPEGFNRFTPKVHVDNWVRVIQQRSNEIILSSSFKVQENSILKKLKLKEINRLVANKQLKLLYKQIPVNYLEEACVDLTLNFNIPRHFTIFLKEYILSNKIIAPMNNFGAGLYPSGVLPRNAGYVPIKVYSSLTDKDLKDLKNYINDHFKNSLKMKALRNLERDIEVEDWYKRKEKFDEVEQKQYKMTAKEISKNLFGTHGRNQQVYESVRQMKRLRTKRFHSGR